MPSDRSDSSSGTVGASYAAFQLSKALTAAEHGADAEARANAEARATRWRQVMEHILAGTAAYGSRTPFADVPAWATLEVATGGFATGALLAGGALTEYERALATSCAGVRAGRERLDLNAWHLTDAGLDALQQRLRSGDYRIDVPEEAALPTVAWLIAHGRADDARALIETIAPYFDRLRFFPPSAQGATPAAAEVHVFTAGDAARRLACLSEQPRLAAQRRAIAVRLPLYDEAVALCLQTYDDGWPCRHYPDGWRAAAQALCARAAASQDVPREAHSSANDRAQELLSLLALCARDPASLSGRQVGRIRRIVDDFVRAHGRPGSDTHRALRERQRRDVAAPPHHRIGHAVAARLAAYPAGEGIADFAPLSVPMTAEEAQTYALEAGAPLPPAVLRRLRCCRRGTIAELIACGLITSGDTLARVLPALTAEIRSVGFADAALGRLYAATYRAFRRRRSLLLLDLQSQVSLRELPWAAALERERSADATAASAARQALAEAAIATLSAFPHAIVPNKLLQEFRALADTAELDLPFVDEVAADIFMGEFSQKFVDAARRAARTFAGTLYADYYAIDIDALAQLPDTPKASTRRFWRLDLLQRGDALSKMAAERAGVSLGGYRAAENGTVLEQAQILTTHNLALLFDAFDLKTVLRPQLAALALRCFDWICERQRLRLDDWHARLIMVKKTAYAWRQMLFFLSMLDDASRRTALEAIEVCFLEQPEWIRDAFAPAMRGLRLAAAGQRLPQPADASHDVNGGANDGARVFLGWTVGPHWFLSNLASRAATAE